MLNDIEIESIAKDFRGMSFLEMQSRIGPDLAKRVEASLKAQAPSNKSIFSEYQRKIKQAGKELGQAMYAAGINGPKHSVEDYEKVILLQLDMFSKEEKTSISRLLSSAFPNDPAKAKSLGGIKSGARIRKAYNSVKVRNHPVEIALQIMYGKNMLNRRYNAGNFGKGLAIGAVLLNGWSRITNLENEVDLLKQRVERLEQQIKVTKTRNSLTDAGATSTKEKVLFLKSEGKGATEISRLLNAPLNTVKSILNRSTNVGLKGCI
ncbi:hypothetical protein Meth11DRAFT_1995 [Methylophilaceae bacterium 11]|nr:hypothetical protein Meth11DRAFT_1995 [Methylophilaceae bacterium 11]